MKFVNTYDINIDNIGVWTMGLSTCMFIGIKTTKSFIGWHYGAENMYGLNMKRILCLLKTIKDEDVLRVYLIPGADRDKDLSLTKDCRTMKYRPNTIPTESRDWLFNFMRIYNWWDKLETLEPVEDYKEIVKINRIGYEHGRNDELHDMMCIQDAEKMI